MTQPAPGSPKLESSRCSLEHRHRISVPRPPSLSLPRPAGPHERLRSTHQWGCRGRSPLPEREVSSHFSLPQGGPQARKTNYEWISGKEVKQQLRTVIELLRGDAEISTSPG